MPNDPSFVSANVSGQTDTEEIFVSDANGQNRVQVTQLKGPRIGRIRWSADSKSFDVIYDQRGIREEMDKTGRPSMYNLFPLIRTWKVADIGKR